MHCIGVGFLSTVNERVLSSNTASLCILSFQMIHNVIEMHTVVVERIESIITILFHIFMKRCICNVVGN